MEIAGCSCLVVYRIFNPIMKGQLQPASYLFCPKEPSFESYIFEGVYEFPRIVPYLRLITLTKHPISWRQTIYLQPPTPWRASITVRDDFTMFDTTIKYCIKQPTLFNALYALPLTLYRRLKVLRYKTSEEHIKPTALSPAPSNSPSFFMTS